MTSPFETPSFRRENLSRDAPQEDGDAFQQFVFEVLHRKYGDLYRYPTRGKDGGIDLVRPADRPSWVFECKVLGEDGQKAARKAWREVAKKLRKYLEDPAGPPPGQAQYQPFYETDPALRVYVFCISSQLGNHAQRLALLREIREFFVGLANQHPHLAHLRPLRALVLDDGSWKALLADHPDLVFKWFAKARPAGLVPLDSQPVSQRSFRQFLSAGRLPFYSRRTHLDRSPPPTGVAIPDEAELLHLLQEGDTTGLVITGGGGYGKTRLMLELGRLATSRDWLVCQLQGSYVPGTLERLADRMNPDSRALLLVDYLETQPTFVDLVQTLNLLADERRLPLRYIACCRTTFYPSVQILGRHRRIDLAPLTESPALVDWWNGFREAAVRHIVEETGLPEPERVVAMSREVPVLAVFAAWLHVRDRGDDLSELLSEPDFGLWVAKRHQQTFGDTRVHRDLAELVALFPLAVVVVERLSNRQRDLLDRLASDGWIEKVNDLMGSAPRWEVAHDVFADRVLLSYVETAPASLEVFVQELLREAGRLDSTVSALTSLQRVGGVAGLRAIPWHRLLPQAMTEQPPAWRPARLLALRSSLLSLAGCVSLLGLHGALWEGAEEEVETQNLLGWFALQASRGELTDKGLRSFLIDWMERAAHHVDQSNYLLTQALKLDAERFRESASRWLRTKPALFQTHYLLVAWLEAKLPPQEVRGTTATWLSARGPIAHASFVLRSWLDAQGDRDLVQPFLLPWLQIHGEALEARFVLPVWLDAQGDRDLVQPFLLPWLQIHAEALEAQFVLYAWLSAQGERDLVQPFLLPWLQIHGEALEASFVFRAWLSAQGERDLVQPFLLPWLQIHGEALEASFVFQAWLDAQGDRDLVQPFLLPWLQIHGEALEASFVLPSWLKAQGDRDLVQPFLLPWLQIHGEALEASFVLQAWLYAQGDRDLVQPFLLPWLQIHGEALEAQFVLYTWLNAQGDRDLVQPFLLSWLQRHGEALEADFILKAWLEAGGAFQLIEEPALRWIHAFRNRQEAVYLTKYIARQKRLPEEAVRDILAWCRAFARDQDAAWRLSHLDRHLLRPELRQDVVETLTAVVTALAAGDQAEAPIPALVTSIFARLSNDPETRKATLPVFLAWLRLPLVFEAAGPPSRDRTSKMAEVIEKGSLLLYLRDAIETHALHVDADKEALRRFFEWVAGWSDEGREQADWDMREIRKLLEKP